MSTLIRPEISKKKTEWIPKNRYYELKYFSLQYPEWKKQLKNISYIGMRGDTFSGQIEFSDPTERIVEEYAGIIRKVDAVEKCTILADISLSNYILMAVTTGATYESLSLLRDMPCGRGKFYKAYRKYFWLLDKEV